MTTNLTPPDQKSEDPGLQPPDAGYSRPQKRSLLSILLIAFTLFVIFDIAVLAYFFLAGKNKHQQVQTQPVQSVETRADTVDMKSVVTGKATIDPGARSSVMELRSRWLKLQAVAEADAVRIWAEIEFTAITQKAGQAERLLAAREYQQAGELFQQAVNELESLQDARPDLLAEAIATGNHALAEENSTEAARAFTRALALSPENPQAEHGLARARSLEQVLALYAKGLEFEKAGELKAATDTLSRAAKLDPEYQPAVQALARVQARQEEADFQQAMGGFLQALTIKDVKKAENELSRASRLRSQAVVVIDGKKQLRQLVLQQTLGRLQQEYERFAAAEQWRQAKERCEQALKIDPQAAFALSGLQAATHRLELDRALQGILNRPQRLQEDGPLQEARQTLAAAESVPDPGPRLSKQITAVRAQLVAATQKVLVVVQSDNATEVVIYRVGRLGMFTRRELQLRPGRYTAIGSRPGYRDVRKVFEIQPGAGQASLLIRCEEII